MSYRNSKEFKERFEKVKKIALKYKRRGHFQKYDRNNYVWAHHYGLLDEVCSHMVGKYKNIKWYMSSLKKESKKFKSRGEFQKKSRSAYMAAYTNNILDEVCPHMPKPIYRKNTKKIYFSKIKKLSLTYPLLSDFCRENMGIYYALKRNNKYDVLKKIHKKFYKDNSFR